MGFKYIVTTIDKSVLDTFLSSPIVEKIKDNLIICADQNCYADIINDSKYNKYQLIDMKTVVDNKYKEYNCDESLMSRFKTFRKIFMYDYLLDQGITDFHITDDDVYLFREIPFTETTLIPDILCYRPMIRYLKKGYDKYNYLTDKTVILVGNMTIKFTPEMINDYKSILKDFVHLFHTLDLPQKQCKTYNFFMDTFFMNCLLNSGKYPMKYVDKYNSFYIVSSKNAHYYSEKFNPVKIKEKGNCIAIHFAGKDKEKIYKNWHDIIIKMKKEYPDVEL